MYDPDTTEEHGTFYTGDDGTSDKPQSHPYLLRFETDGRTGDYVKSDDIYWALSDYRYPIMANTIENQGFCSPTPRETEIFERELGEADDHIEPESISGVTFDEEHLVPFRRDFAPSSPKAALSEMDIEAAVLANPRLLPEALQPKGRAVCRQVPMTPFKPSSRQQDRVDIAYYDPEDPLNHSTLPNEILELKGPESEAKGDAAEQANRYLEWLNRILWDKDISESVSATVLAARFSGFQEAPVAHGDSLRAWRFGRDEPEPGTHRLSDYFNE